MFIGLHVKYRYCCQILMKLEFSRHIFEKYSHIKFPVGAELCHADGQTHMTKLAVAFRNFGRHLTKPNH